MGRTVLVDEPYQQGYRYECQQAPGRGFDPGFSPDLTPRQLLVLGVFGGNYFSRPPHEFPARWFSGVRLSDTGHADAALNYFGVHASQPLSVWEQKGWIFPEDPKGWFLWYCRYYLGRRIPEEDARQIGRWRNMRRHVTQLQRHCPPGDLGCRPRQRQALLHWAYDSRAL